MFTVPSNQCNQSRIRTNAWCRRLRTVSLGLVMLALAACSRVPGEESNLRRILTDQVARYPRMQVQDLYKFLHQAALGSEHAVRDTAMARDWLRREIAGLDTATAFEPLVAPLSPDGKLVRVHLRPYLRNGDDPEALLHAFIRTANEARGDSATLEYYWSIAEAMCLQGRLPFPRGDMEAFFAARREQGFPAVHHSEVYGQLYRPAYRVILRDLLQPGRSAGEEIH